MYTPRLKNSNKRLHIERHEFEKGFNFSRGIGIKGIMRDLDTGKRYRISGASCDAPNCQCDAIADEIK